MDENQVRAVRTAATGDVEPEEEKTGGKQKIALIFKRNLAVLYLLKQNSECSAQNVETICCACCMPVEIALGEIKNWFRDGDAKLYSIFEHLSNCNTPKEKRIK